MLLQVEVIMQDSFNLFLSHSPKKIASYNPVGPVFVILQYFRITYLCLSTFVPSTQSQVPSFSLSVIPTHAAPVNPVRKACDTQHAMVMFCICTPLLRAGPCVSWSFKVHQSL